MSNLAPGLSERFINLKDKRPIEVWEDLWQEEKTPWDRGVHNPALEDVLVQKSDILESAVVKSEGQEKLRKKALVPGCGRGVDCFLLASFGYDTYGLEYSTTALEACRKETAKYGDTVKPRDLEIGGGKVIFLQGDFFEDEWLKGAGLEEGCFDLIYDYTVSIGYVLYDGHFWFITDGLSDILWSPVYFNSFSVLSILRYVQDGL